MHNLELHIESTWQQMPGAEDLVSAPGFSVSLVAVALSDEAQEILCRLCRKGIIPTTGFRLEDNNYGGRTSYRFRPSDETDLQTFLNLLDAHFTLNPQTSVSEVVANARETASTMWLSSPNNR